MLPLNVSTWRDLYPDALEELPGDAPKPKGSCMRITIWVDADHAHDKVTCRSVTGVVVMLNNVIVKTFSKRQTTVESSTYGSEMIAARIGTDMAVEIRHMLHMLGVPIDGSALMLGDNKSVVLNTTIPSSALKKKHQMIACRCVPCPRQGYLQVSYWSCSHVKQCDSENF